MQRFVEKEFQRIMLPKVKELWTHIEDSGLPILYRTRHGFIRTKELTEFDRLAKEFNEPNYSTIKQDEYEATVTEAL